MDESERKRKIVVRREFQHGFLSKMGFVWAQCEQTQMATTI